MNLIQKLQTTPKWKEFEEWYNKQGYYIPIKGYFDENYFAGFDDDLGFEFQKGVFEKFISKDSTNITVDGYIVNETYGIPGATFAQWKWFESFEELLIWYFNN